MASAWPKVFYSISIAPIGPVHFGKLRTQVQRALGLQKYGANPELQCACLCPIKCDPEYFALWETVVAFRMYAIPEIAYVVLDEGAGGKKTTPGPFSSLLKSLHKIGWRWEHPHVVDSYGITIDIKNCPIAELKERLTLAWQERTCRMVEDLRTAMQGLRCADVAMTMKNFHITTPDKEGLMRCALNGTFFTNDVLVHTNKVENSLCSFCGHEDSICHRMFHCEHFQEIRSKLTPQTLQTMFHRACPVFLYGVLWVGWVGGSSCDIALAILSWALAFELLAWKNKTSILKSSSVSFDFFSISDVVFGNFSCDRVFIPTSFVRCGMFGYSM